MNTQDEKLINESLQESAANTPTGPTANVEATGPTTAPKQPAPDPVKTWTEGEVAELLKAQKDELRKLAADVIKKKDSEIATAGQDEFFDLTKWDVMKRMAKDMVQSGALPQTDNEYTVLVKMQAGREMGMKPFESVKSFYIVNGVLNIYGAATIKRLREHGWNIEYVEKQNECFGRVTKGTQTYSETLTFADAEASKWTKNRDGGLKAGWFDGANRRMKLRYGVLSIIIKTYIPEVLGSAIDIAEIAIDAMPAIQTERLTTAVAGAAEDATEQQVESIKNMGGQLPDDVESGERKLTRQEAADTIRALMLKKNKK